MMQDPERPEGLAPQEPLDALYFPPPPERDPFWDYGDLLIFAGLTLPCLTGHHELMIPLLAAALIEKHS